ncbi:tetratricopeptide repeat protein [Aquipseudomonas alcaligenes]|uniref:tetratricopeptide repeat protein n=1 Tax=Aquipseudomonas alcaligenes TaxID=43263 RepID=UPI00242EC788|nr:tetratricopeptide repeat protein [Pseudomonas alcaligenes]
MIREWMREFCSQQAEVAFREGDYTRTRTCCEWVLREEPGHTGMRVLLGEAALAVHDQATALRAWQALVGQEPQNAYYWFQLAKTYLQLKEWAVSLGILTKAQNCAPDNAEIAQARASVQRLLEAQNRLQQSRETAESLTDHTLREGIRQAAGQKDWAHVRDLAAGLERLDDSLAQSLGVAFFHLGQFDEARAHLQAVAPAALHADGLAVLAGLRLREGDPVAALALVERALAQQADHLPALLVRGGALLGQGEEQAAEATYRQALRLHPHDDEAVRALGGFLAEAGRLEDAEALFRRATVQQPDDWSVWYNLGTLRLSHHQDLAGALECYERAYALKDDELDVLNNLGVVYRSLGKLEQAEQCFLKSLRIEQGQSGGWRNLGLVYGLQARHVDSEGCLQRAIALAPDQSLGWIELAGQNIQANAPALAEKYARAALSIESSPSGWNVLGMTLLHQMRNVEAEQAFERAIELAEGAEQYGPLINLAGLYSSTLRIEQAMGLLERHLYSSGGFYSNYLFTLNYHPHFDHREVLRRYLEVTRHFYPQPAYRAYANDHRPTRRLRIGYVSPDFRFHSCRSFILPLLSHHQHRDFEIYAYSDVRFPDAATEEFKGMVDVWCHARGFSHAQLAERVREDRIDILVDLAGHTDGNRLQMFALKPAPVQVSWMGYGYTTGLPQIDYLLCDRQFLPPGYEDAIAEKPWCLDGALFCYQGPGNWPLPDGSAFERNGYITFGTLTRTIRLNQQVFELWAELLHRVPDSRLIMNTKTLGDEVTQAQFRRYFTERGIAGERVILKFSSPAFEAMREIDIILDCFPHNSGTTLYEALWQGLPFVSLKHRPTMGRMGATILHGLGRPQWAVDTPEEYLEVACALANDRPGLRALHRNLRAEMQASRLCDGAAFALSMEQAYRQMWERYCAEAEA